MLAGIAVVASLLAMWSVVGGYIGEDAVLDLSPANARYAVEASGSTFVISVVVFLVTYHLGRRRFVGRALVVSGTVSVAVTIVKMLRWVAMSA